MTPLHADAWSLNPTLEPQSACSTSPWLSPTTWGRGQQPALPPARSRGPSTTTHPRPPAYSIPADAPPVPRLLQLPLLSIAENPGKLTPLYVITDGRARRASHRASVHAESQAHLGPRTQSREGQSKHARVSLSLRPPAQSGPVSALLQATSLPQSSSRRIELKDRHGIGKLMLAPRAALHTHFPSSPASQQLHAGLQSTLVSSMRTSGALRAKQGALSDRFPLPCACRTLGSEPSSPSPPPDW